jgi:hypothetical protein
VISGGIKNPLSVPEPVTGSFYIETLTVTSGYIISQGIVANTIVTPILPTPFAIAPTIVRGSTELGAYTSYNFDFILANPIPSGGKIQIRAPLD